jgi:hypothetical protein
MHSSPRALSRARVALTNASARIPDFGAVQSDGASLGSLAANAPPPAASVFFSRATLDHRTSDVPLVILGGTAQSAASYAAHLRALAMTMGRDVLCIELRGQGQTTLR